MNEIYIHKFTILEVKGLNEKNYKTIDMGSNDKILNYTEFMSYLTEQVWHDRFGIINHLILKNDILWTKQ